MISFVANAADISRIRIASSPTGEIVFSIRIMGALKVRSPHRRWLTEAAAKLRRTDFRPLFALVPPSGYVPDFLTPPPTLGRSDLDSQLEAIRATDPDEFVDQVAWMATDPLTSPEWKEMTAATRRGLLDAPQRSLAEIVGLLAEYWRVVMEPGWQRVEDRLRVDIRARLQLIEKSGVSAVLSALHDRVAWRESSLQVQSRYEYANEMGGQGFVLVPSVFCPPTEILTMMPPQGSMVIYPVPDLSGLWDTFEPDDTSALGALLGGVRAGVLEALRSPLSTGVIAAQIGVTPGAVSQHLGVLRTCGLVDSHRDGRRVVHSLTELGEDLIRNAGLGSPRWPA